MIKPAFICVGVDGHLDYFSFFAVRTSVALKIHITCLSGTTCKFIVRTDHGMLGGRACICSALLVITEWLFHSGCTNLHNHSHQLTTLDVVRLPFLPS